MIEVNINTIALDTKTGTPVVILKEKDGEGALPIWIGPFEADAISRALNGEKFSRPLTHNLLINIIKGLKAKVIKVIINDLRENTYFARIYIQREEEIVEIDARPSDSLAISALSKCPIYIEEKVIEQSEMSIEEDQEVQKKRLQNHLKRLNPTDFGKYDI